MTTKVLLTHHHREAMENAAERGFWMPLELPEEQLGELMYLTSLSYGETSLKQLVEISSLEPWREPGCPDQWLPFLGQRLDLPRPLPLGDRRALAGWLPRQRGVVQIVDLDALLAARSLSEVLPGSGAHCPLRPGAGRPAAAVLAPVPRRAAPVDYGIRSWRTAH